MSWLLITILPLFSLSSDPSLADHEFHVSKCMVEYSAPDQALQISMHLFIDDLEEALRQQGADKLFLCSNKEDPKAEQYLFKYMQEHLYFIVDDIAYDYEFVGKEISEDLQAVWCYMEITGLSNIESVTITNDLLMEIFEDQKNIMNISGPNKKRGFFLFQKGQSTDTAKF